ncbi:MAG: HlyD family efflux transporter periplasmic adaptor subunit [Alphaproteobacteria bacterium]
MTVSRERRGDGTGSLIALLDLQRRVLKAGSPAEVAFIAVNEVHVLVPFRQAALWSGRGGVEAVSGLATPEANAPFLLWLEPVFRHLARRHPEAAEVTSADLPPVLAEQWSEWMPPCALWVPIGSEAEEAGLLFAKDHPWRATDRLLLAYLGDAVTAARARFLRPSPFRSWLPRLKSRRGRIALVLGGILVALMPVTGSVLAPADVVPAHPVVVRSPLDGVVDRIHVRPNDTVTEGQSLFDLDATTLSGRLDVARQAHATAEAEHRQVAQAQVFDQKAKAQVAILQGRMEEKAAEARWLQSQLDRIRVTAPRAGVVVLDDPSDWIGRPVAVGEKVMLVADETDTEIEAWASVADAGEARPGARLTLFLNTAPLSPVRATVRTVAYEAAARPDGTLAHRIRATLEDGSDKPRLGAKGTARIDGDTVPLVWWLFRRPLATVRQTLGF